MTTPSASSADLSTTTRPDVHLLHPIPRGRYQRLVAAAIADGGSIEDAPTYEALCGAGWNVTGTYGRDAATCRQCLAEPEYVDRDPRPVTTVQLCDCKGDPLCPAHGFSPGHGPFNVISTPASREPDDHPDYQS